VDADTTGTVRGETTDIAATGRRRFLQRAVRLLPVLAAAPLLPACAELLPGQSPPPRLFVLTPKSTFPDDLPTVDWQLIIEIPQAAAGLDTTRISLQRSAKEHEYYARASWTDRAPTLVQTLMVESFENSGKIIAVGRESLGLRADYVIKSELREFQAMYLDEGLPPEAFIRMGVKLVEMPERSIVGSRTIEARVRAEADTLESIVDAFDDALGKVLKNIVSWTLVTADAIEQQRRRRR
jgi:cholesterol transport system auxiliary component